MGLSLPRFILGVCGALCGLLGPPARAADSYREPPHSPAEAAAPDRVDLAIGFMGMGEVWQDEAIIDHYRSSRFSGSGFATVGLFPWFAVETEVGYMRMSSDSGRSGVAPGSMEVVPITVSGLVRSSGRRAEAFGGVGYAMTVFAERTDVGTVAGIKPGFDVRSGVRIHTNMVQPTMAPNGSPGLRGLDVELLLGRRQHHAFGVGQGLDFSAWRAGVGLVARL
jgi:hypothetical protein